MARPGAGPATATRPSALTDPLSRDHPCVTSAQPAFARVTVTSGREPTTHPGTATRRRPPRPDEGAVEGEEEDEEGVEEAGGASRASPRGERREPGHRRGRGRVA